MRKGLDALMTSLLRIGLEGLSRLGHQAAAGTRDGRSVRVHGMGFLIVYRQDLDELRVLWI